MIEVLGIKKAFDGNQVLNGIDLKVETGTSVVVLGPSGIGKTVLLKIMVRLLPPDEGDVFYDNRSILKMGRSELNRLRKRIGFVFQSSALFDSMTVFDNVALRLYESGFPDVRERVTRILEEFKLLPARDRFPGELSGGMKKLVSLARAIVTNPDYLFYDEPTAGLDPATGERIVAEIIRLKDQLGATSIVVTHDLDVAFRVGDRVMMLKGGKLREVRSRKEARGYYE
ncbi:ABC transporter ATP-binding protein [candidate division WOR-3 bacterium]|uniref:ABC transporter ATP-binding protein n=1 Tax=candidate division WOR-3 bacterium TaxID=2052148 RepID=A0A660SGX7_UNCW3|nr:MAG: ABC transporter ATP-binding protein [candidate division WOR-3 bacterium]